MVNAMYLHGRDSTGKTRKAEWIKQQVPALLSPTFGGSLDHRMEQLAPLLQTESWVLIGSSYGGLMAALWTHLHPGRVVRLILLAPALHHEDFAPTFPVLTPTLLIHGQADTVVPPDPVEEKARRAFANLTVWRVQDDHRLLGTCESLTWPALIESGW
ncbi:alpha/beta fold hydrolase [bacterium]|nr:alpha/beta fold hydrolase [bacterium]